jgi:catecholate siderophore receptor
VAPAVPAGTTQDSSYQPTVNSSLSRVPTSLRNTPQTVNVVPQVVMREQNVSTMQEALRNVAGITFRAGEGGNQGDTPYIRGFSAQNDMFRDGIRDPGFYNRDVFATDAFEVYKGPSSILFGRGSTGGAINAVSKLPKDRPFVEGAVTGNTGPGVRATVDANGKITENVAARIVVMGQRYDIPDRDRVEQNRWGVAPSIKFQFDARTTNTLSYIYQHDNNIPDYGIPFMTIAAGNPRPIVPVPRNTWYGILSGPLPDVEKLDAHTITNKFEHQINKDFKFTNTTRYADIDHFQRNVFPQPTPSPAVFASGVWTPNRNQISVRNTIFSNNADLVGKFETGPLTHTVATGVEVSRETRDFLRGALTPQVPTTFFNPDPWRPGGVPQPPNAGQLLSGEATDIAFYVADQVKINQFFELLGSIRVEQYKFKQNAPLAAPIVQDISRTDDIVSWRAGGVFHPTLNSSVYAMHGTSFNPSADSLSINPGTNAAGNLNALSLASLGPEKNETTEIGVKADVLGGKLSLASAVFHTVKTNMRVPDPANSSVTILAGEVDANGFEASAAGKLTDLWQIIASYTYVHARVTKTTNLSQLGTEPTNTPTHAFSLWTTYDVTPDFQIGGGAFFNSEVYGDTGSAATPQSALVPSWWRFDAMAAYKVSRNATLQLNIYNIADELYYTNAYSNWVVPAPGRMAALTYRVTYSPEESPRRTWWLPARTPAFR